METVWVLGVGTVAVLALQELRKVYAGRVEALRGITYECAGGTLGLVGPNGAGKTTLMRILATITRPTSGRAWVQGIDVARHPLPIRSMLGYLPQQFDFYPGFSVIEVLAYIADLKRVARRERAERVEACLDLAGLAQYRSRRVGTLSGGMKRRLGIAQALLNRPELLIVDEPTAGLDPEERVRFRSLLSSLSRDRLVILSTHIVFDVEAVASQLVIISEGSILFTGTTAEAVARVQGRVWQMRSDRAEPVTRDRDGRCIPVGSRQEGDGWVVRLLAPDRPRPDAEPVPPTLEDAYLYLVGRTAW